MPKAVGQLIVDWSRSPGLVVFIYSPRFARNVLRAGGQPKPILMSVEQGVDSKTGENSNAISSGKKKVATSIHNARTRRDMIFEPRLLCKLSVIDHG